MKGRLMKTDQGWIVIYDQILGDGIVKKNQNALPLHPEYQTILPLDLDLEGKEVEFDWCVIVEHYTGKGKEYAKLITPSRKHSITDYGVEGIDSCLEYKENDVEKLDVEEYPISKGGSMWMPTSFDLDQSCRQEGFIKGYNKAKETLYTEEQVREAIDMTRRGIITDAYGDLEVEYLLEKEQIIQSIKQPKQ
jgi:hypothetical protein